MVEPAALAVHFDSQGRPDNWWPPHRLGAVSLAIGIALPGFVVGMSYAARFFDPAFVNLPNADYWRLPQHYPEACEIILRRSLWLAAGLILWVADMNYQLLWANHAEPPHLPVAVIWSAAVALLLFCLGWGIGLFLTFRSHDAKAG